MRLRSRIALTFIALIGAVIGAALLAVSAANRANALREISRQLDVGRSVLSRLLDSNHRQLVHASEILAADYGFRDAVTSHDAATIASALDNHGARIGAAFADFVATDGQVVAASVSSPVADLQSRPFDLPARGAPQDTTPHLRVHGGRVYQEVMVPVRAPLTIGWIVMGFALDSAMVRELAAVTGLDVTVTVRTSLHANPVASSLPAAQARSVVDIVAAGAGRGDDDLVYSVLPLHVDGSATAEAILSRSFAAARAPFDRLRDHLVAIGLVSLALAAAAALWLAQNITHPLRSLTAAIEAIRAGRYQTTVHVARADELGALAEGLQLMQAAVDSRDREIRTLAYRDRLTGLMNRAAFAQELGALLGAGMALSIAVVNVRGFRRINECLGYPTGDVILIEMARRLSAEPPLGSSVAHLGADHFALVTEIRPGVHVGHWVSQILDRFGRSVSVADQEIDIRVVVGTAVAPSDSTDADELLRCADLAVERAQRDNRAWRSYEPGFKVATRAQLSLLGELQRAIDQDELALAYQPKIALNSGRLVGVEALLRWRHPSKGLIMPGEFIPFAEQSGFISRLTRWAVRRAALMTSHWAAAGEPLGVSVNISADDLADEHFVDFLRETLENCAVPAGLLTLELTETGVIGNPEQALARLEFIRTLGVGVAIDDFGTGYSSLSYLSRMPVNELKIDRSFVVALDETAQAEAVVQAAIDLGHRLGLSVVAEGIETPDVAARLAVLGCDVGQGYVYAKPLMQEAFEQWRRERAVEPTTGPEVGAKGTDGVLISARG